VSTLAQPASVEAPAGRRRRSAAAKRRRVDRGILWIALLALLLAGVVAVNVAVLQLNVQLDQLGRERVQLRDDNARLRAELSSSAATARTERRARNELGLVEADPLTTAYVDLAPKR
jgi:cell division protein FtsL